MVTALNKANLAESKGWQPSRMMLDPADEHYALKGASMLTTAHQETCHRVSRCLLPCTVWLTPCKFGRHQACELFVG